MLGPSKVCNTGTRWMWNQIPYLTSSLARNLSKNTGRYVENTNKKVVFLYDKYVNLTIMVDLFYWNSIVSWIPNQKSLLLAHFFIRPIFYPKFPLMIKNMKKFSPTFMFSIWVYKSLCYIRRAYEVN